MARVPGAGAGKRTRKQRAAALQDTLTRGPSISLDSHKLNLTPEQITALDAHIKERYSLWANTWVLPELVQLIPELKSAE